MQDPNINNFIASLQNIKTDLFLLKEAHKNKKSNLYHQLQKRIAFNLDLESVSHKDINRLIKKLNQEMEKAKSNI